MEKGKKVFVGLSGGVDSSVSALLLKEQGYDVTGVFIKVWQPENITCTWKEDRLDAMRVAAKLDIPFLTLDAEQEYKEGVIDYMIAEYKAGRTPNPDVMCNKYVKFGSFLNYAKEAGADYVATGHYARVNCLNNTCQFLAGVDKNKDQSYFLWTLTQERLKHVLFPVGELEKPEVRKIAEKAQLITAGKKDSQGLCFIGKLNIKEFLKDYIEEKKGDVINEDGQVVGSHDGVYFYTKGQRHGFNIPKTSPDEEPYYVVGKNVQKNELLVSHKKDGSLAVEVNEISIDEINLIGDKPKKEDKILMRIRYRQNLFRGTVDIDEKKVYFKESQTVDAGQSVVFYRGDECLGGAVIV